MFVHPSVLFDPVLLSVCLSVSPRSMQELLVKFEPPDLMGFPPDISSLPGDEHFRSESIYGVASISGSLHLQMERDSPRPRLYS